MDEHQYQVGQRRGVRIAPWQGRLAGCVIEGDVEDDA